MGLQNHCLDRRELFGVLFCSGGGVFSDMYIQGGGELRVPLVGQKRHRIVRRRPSHKEKHAEQNHDNKATRS